MERLYTVEDVAELLDLKRTTVLKKVRAGEIGYIRNTRRRGKTLFTEKMVEQFLARQTFEPKKKVVKKDTAKLGGDRGRWKKKATTTTKKTS